MFVSFVTWMRCVAAISSHHKHNLQLQLNKALRQKSLLGLARLVLGHTNWSKHVLDSLLRTLSTRLIPFQSSQRRLSVVLSTDWFGGKCDQKAPIYHQMPTTCQPALLPHPEFFVDSWSPQITPSPRIGSFLTP